MSRRIPTTIITGFLGAGKTTLIRSLIEQATSTRLALIINEFGEVPLDGQLISSECSSSCKDIPIHELANGCLCCTVAEEFLPTIQALLDSKNLPDHILIETSGLALPKPLLQAFAWPEVRTRITVDSVVALVDGPAIVSGQLAPDLLALAAARKADPSLDHESSISELFEDQITAADLVILTKSDQLTLAQCEEARSRLCSYLRPGVTVLTSDYGRMNPSLILGIGAAAEYDLANRPSHHDGDEPHDHDDFTSFSLILPPIKDPQLLHESLKDAAERFGILRVKGYVKVMGKPMQLVVQAVGPRVETCFSLRESCRENRGPENRGPESGGQKNGGQESRDGLLIVIGKKDLDITAVRTLLFETIEA